MGFNDLLLIEPTPVSAFDHLEDIEEAARDRIATRLQGRLRNVVDPGVDLQAATRAQKIKVTSSGDTFEIGKEDQADVLRRSDEPSSDADEDPNIVGNIEQLFEMSSGVPTVRGDGSLVYRTISPAMLFGDQQRAQRTQDVEQSVTSTLRDELIDAYEDAVQDVRHRTPGA